MVEDKPPLTASHIHIKCVYKVIEHLNMLWMGIWGHPYPVIPVQVLAKFWKIGERLSQHDVVVS